MARVDDLRERLPGVYRPEPGDRGLVMRLLAAVGRSLDGAAADAGDVMQAHWLPFANRGLYSRFVLRSRQEERRPPPDPRDPDDALELERFPYLDDLARLAAILPVPPWQELLPAAAGEPAQREAAEAYRERIRRIVALYRNGLGTPAALRRIVEAQLPVDVEAPAERRDRGFSVEEFVSPVADALDVRLRGVPDDLVGPLMRWQLVNDGLEPAAPTILVEGIEPGTVDPLLELFADAGGRQRVGIAFRGTVPAGRTLRLRPAASSWLGLDGGLVESRSLDDPTAPGPWAPAAGAPGEAPAALLQARDRTIWLGAGNALHRLDGAGWSEALGGLPAVSCLAEDGDDLLVGTESGLGRLTQHPDGGFALDPVLEDVAVHALLRDGGGWLVATARGLVRLAPGGPPAPFVLGTDDGTATPVRALARDGTGAVYAGGELGLFQLQAAGDAYWYEGAEASDQLPDWQPFLPDGSFPAAGDVFLPPVLAVHRGPDASLWIGTERGLARYVARAERGLAYTTLLEAFPDLGDGPVRAIATDARGLTWFGTDRGLLLHDGRDLWQFREDGGWTQLGRADRLYGADAGPRGAWRFSRASGQWQRLRSNGASPAWIPFTGEPRTTDEPTVRLLAWTDGAVADLLGGDEPEPVDPASLLVRFKPDDTRIVAGGVPAIPRLPAGASTWRYLALEPEDAPEPEARPSWTVEGRLLPPPADREAAPPGRFDLGAPPPESLFDEAVFAFPPAARVRFEWQARRPFGVLARLRLRAADEHIEPAVLDRVHGGMEQVRPAGVNAVLAVGEVITRGGANGPAG